ncbi:hypothetical protein CCS41_04665 [Candidatus Fukatsuia symbiotica]|uniref:Uncharacterized protein n=1 Tax=Candidatus Fukatsuia symbiotica TaxID=1878942 RepID=A0A2U8I8C5_9GAMM|nr:hypothetical protein CCS41_04665 [Candidatus Fukatsuia symbiotica]
MPPEFGPWKTVYTRDQ